MIGPLEIKPRVTLGGGDNQSRMVRETERRINRLL